MITMFKRLILHPFTFAIFPIAALLAFNIGQVAPRVALRSAAISLAATVILILVLALISRSWQKAALITTSFLILFFSYGHVYEFLQAHPIFGFSLGRHRYLLVIYSLILILVVFLSLRRKVSLSSTTAALNVIGILLLIFPLYQIIKFTVQTSISEHRLAENSTSMQMPAITTPSVLPDIYFIIMDSYARQDALMADLNFDNSPFLDELRSMGFYIADCSRSNNSSTHGSVAITLNMDYIIQLRDGLVAQGLSYYDDTPLIRQSLVRKMLTSIGYKTVAFESGYEFMRLRDADVYLRYTGEPYEMQVLQPFEVMLIRTTALMVWSDTVYTSQPDFGQNPFTGISDKFNDDINRQRYILDQLPKLASYPGPKFVFVHIEIPHPPYIFLPNGEIAMDPDLYSGYLNRPVDDAHFVEGYLNEMQFINSRMPDILQALISESKTPPIILLLGDTGPHAENIFKNLETFYFPGDGSKNLYPTITPLNIFRVVFNTYFGAHMDLLPDISYNSSGEVVPEDSPACMQK